MVYLKKLDILGFKSFANKTTVHFSHGITAVVGPNGCGKTNILDSLRWVLGEQKTSLLRGAKMEEVIFNGTAEVKPMGMAEVSLTVVNDRGILPTEYSEVQITRRLFRSGESEYLLNRVPCRLRDIQELFYDTGVGAHSYSVIQQDMIDAVISDKAEERRFLFEEAAGITKYKQRKRIALRKLEATENDLLRLKDIYAEVQTQVRSLKRQYRKAERYQQELDQVKAWELYLGARRVRAIEAEKRELRAVLDELADGMTRGQTTVDRLSADIESERRRQTELEHHLVEIGAAVYEVTERAHALEKEISVLTEKRHSARALVERNERELAAMRERAAVLDRQQSEATALGERQRAEFEDTARQVADAENAQAEADRNLLAARASRETENRSLLELEGKLSSCKAEEDTLREQEQELAALLEDFRGQMESHRGEAQTAADQLAAARQKLADVTARKASAEQALADLTVRLESLLDLSGELAEELSSLAASLEAGQARKHLLEDMILQFDGYKSGVVAVLEEADRWEGVLGTVADRFVPQDGLEIAAEAALGDMAGYLICDRRETAERIIDHLRAESRGRIGILVPDTGMLNPVTRRPDLSAYPQFIGWLDQFISTADNLRPLMEAVLARTAVFAAGQDPAPILERLPFGFQAVSTDGRVYAKNIIAGGSDDAFPLFRRKEKVAEQQREIDELQARQADTHRRKNEVTAQIAAARAESGSLARGIEDIAEEMEAARAAIAEIEFRQRTLQADLERMDRERRQAGDKLERIRHRQYSLGLDHSRLAGQKDSLVSTMTATDERLADLERAAVLAADRVSRLQVAAVEARSRIEQTESRRTHVAELLDEIARATAEKTEEIGRAEQEISDSARRINELEAALRETFAERTRVTDQQAALRAEQAEIMDRLTGCEKQLKELRAERESLSDRRHEKEMRLNTLESEARAIGDRVREDYGVDVAAIEAPKPDPAVDDQDAVHILAEQKERLKEFGAVNLLALEEYKTAAEREKFLGEQLTDLTTARNDLQTTINKINQTARKLFHDTFEQVRGNFRKLFVELFSGGEADIRMIDPDDPLESDIDITARPRGKKLLSITMMSGGERALTAISLLFSLYMVKPSPFCILDEIDAPLDDANCRRFLRIIDTFSAQTQFIIITHNKITMAAADNLYGVTMGQPGISQLVAVRFSSDDAGTTTVDTERPIEIGARAGAGEPEPPRPRPSTKDREPEPEFELPQVIRDRLQQPAAPDAESDNAS